MDLDEFNSLKKDAERLRRQADQDKGAISQLEKQMVEVLGVGSEAEGGKLLTRLDKEIATLEKDYEKKLTDYQDKYGDKLGE